jgi:hypothetical protein
VTEASGQRRAAEGLGAGPSYGEGSSRTRLGDDGCVAGVPLAVIAGHIEHTRVRTAGDSPLILYRVQVRRASFVEIRLEGILAALDSRAESEGHVRNGRPFKPGVGIGRALGTGVPHRLRAAQSKARLSIVGHSALPQGLTSTRRHSERHDRRVSARAHPEPLLCPTPETALGRARGLFAQPHDMARASHSRDVARASGTLLVNAG